MCIQQLDILNTENKTQFQALPLYTGKNLKSTQGGERALWLRALAAQSIMRSRVKITPTKQEGHATSIILVPSRGEMRISGACWLPAYPKTQTPGSWRDPTLKEKAE